MAQAERVRGVTVPQLMEDLAEVTDWHLLGSSLGLKPSQLSEIEIDIPACDGAAQRRKRRVLDTWMRGKTDDPSWRDIVSALMKMGEHRISDEMRRKYSGSVPVKCAVSEAVKKENQQQIRAKFVKLQMLVCRKLKAMEIDKQEFIFFVEGLFQCTDFIPASNEIGEIFKSMTRNGLWDFLNFSPLREIINAFGGNDEDLNKGLQDYECALAGYHAGTSLVDYIAGKSSFPEEAFDEDTEPSVAIARKDPRYFRKLSIRTSAKFTEKSIDYIIELWKRVSAYLCPPSLVYLLDEIQNGSISATWLVPPIAIPAIILKIGNPETTEFFSKLGIIRVEIDDYCMYEEKQELSESVETATEMNPKQVSSPGQLSDSWEYAQEEASRDVATEQEQDSSLMELSQHGREEDGQSKPHVTVLEEIVSMERKTRKRLQEESDDLRATIAHKEVEIGQLREQVTKLECKLSQTQEEAQLELARVENELEQAREEARS